MSCASSVGNSCRNVNSVTKRPRDTAQRLIRSLQTLPVLLHPLHLNYYFANGSNVPTTHKRTWPLSSSSPFPHSGVKETISQLESSLSSSSPLSSHLKTAESKEVMDGLTCHDLLILTGDATTSFHSNAIMRYCLHLSAIHAVKGGRVIHCCAPGSKSVNMRELIELIECESLRNRREHEQQKLLQKRNNVNEKQQQQDNNGSNWAEETSAEKENKYIKECQAQIISALQHVRVITCNDLTDLELFCHYFTLEETFNSSNTKINTQDNNRNVQTNNTQSNYSSSSEESCQESITPLVFVHDAIGKNSYLYQYERSAGEEVPVLRWLLAALQRRIHCAMIVTESLSGSIDERTIHLAHSLQSKNTWEQEKLPHTNVNLGNKFLSFAKDKQAVEQVHVNRNDFITSATSRNKYNSNEFEFNKNKYTALDQILQCSDFVQRLQSLLSSQQSDNEYFGLGSSTSQLVRSNVHCNTHNNELMKSTRVRRSIADAIAEEKIRKICSPSSYSSSSSSLSVSRTSHCHPSTFDTCTDITKITHSANSALSSKANLIKRVVNTCTELREPWQSNVHRSNIDVQSLRIHCLCITLCSNHTSCSIGHNSFKTLHKEFVNGHLFRIQLVDRIKPNDLQTINVNNIRYGSSSSSKNRRWGKTAMRDSKQEGKVTGDYLCSTQLLESGKAKITHIITTTARERREAN